MRTFRLLRLVVVAISFSASTVAVAAPASPESVEKLLVVTKAEGTLTASYANAERVMHQSMMQAQQAHGGPPMSAEQQQRTDAAIAKVLDLLKEEMSWARMKPQFVRLYVETFDQDEVDGLLAFYATPVGQATIEKMPILLQKTLAMTQSQTMALMPRMFAIVQETMKQPAPGQ